MKTQKSKSEEKMVGFSSASLFPVRKREAVTQGGIGGIEQPREPVSSKVQRTSETGGRIPDIHVKQE